MACACVRAALGRHYETLHSCLMHWSRGYQLAFFRVRLGGRGGTMGEYAMRQDNMRCPDNAQLRVRLGGRAHWNIVGCDDIQRPYTWTINQDNTLGQHARMMPRTIDEDDVLVHVALSRRDAMRWGSNSFTVEFRWAYQHAMRWAAAAHRCYIARRDAAGHGAARQNAARRDVRGDGTRRVRRVPSCDVAVRCTENRCLPRMIASRRAVSHRWDATRDVISGAA